MNTMTLFVCEWPNFPKELQKEYIKLDHALNIIEYPEWDCGEEFGIPVDNYVVSPFYS